MNEWIIIAIVGIVLLFSAKKLPDMARGLGQSMRVFKAETRGMKEDEQAAAAPAPGEAAPGRALEQGGSANGTAASQPVPQNTVPQNTVEGAPRSGA